MIADFLSQLEAKENIWRDIAAAANRTYHPRKFSYSANAYQGPSGPQGPREPQGAQGPQGVSGQAAVGATTNSWRPDELGFFNPDLRDEEVIGKGDIVSLGSHPYYRNAFVFTARIRDVARVKGEQAVRHHVNYLNRE